MGRRKKIYGYQGPKSDDENRRVAEQVIEFIETNGPDYQSLCDLFDVCLIDRQKHRHEFDKDYWLDVTRRMKPWVMDCHIATGKPELGVLLDRIFLYEAPYLFSSYMLYLEKDRNPEDRFYEPRMKQLNKLGIVKALQDIEDGKLKFVSISMPPGTGKSLRVDAKVLTPNGWVRNGDLKVGDTIIGGTGKPCKVLGVYPQGKLSVYKVTMDDGSSTVCSADHLWTVQTRDDRKRGRGYRTVELAKIMTNYRVEKDKRLNYSLDYVPNLEMPEKDFLLHPYVLGALIGNGGISAHNVRFTTADKETLDLVRSLLPDGCGIKHLSRYDYFIFGTGSGRGRYRKNIVKAELKRLGLWGKRSYEKFIPKDYLFASHEQRKWLLRGLMDTDGYAEKSGASCTYTSTSKQLALDVQELVHSLGGYASITEKKNCGYYNADGERVECRDAYNVNIAFQADRADIFALPRKAERYQPKRQKIQRFIKDIQYVGEDYCQCIYIDDPTHLYITDDYILTHNTTLEKFFVSWVMGRYPRDYSLFFSHSADIADMFYRGVLDIIASPDYNWSKIFPGVQLYKTNAKKQEILLNNYRPFANLQCTSIGAGNAGKVRANRYLLCDDLISGIEIALNKNQLDKIWSIYTTDARQRKLNSDVREVMIATRWSVSDPIGRLKMMYEGQPEYKFIAVPDIDPQTGESNFDYDYNGMTVDFFRDQELLMDEITYRCLYKNEPIEREGLLYHEDELRRFDVLPGREPDAILGICDTKSTGIDYMFLPVAYQFDSDFYIEDCVCNNTSDFSVQYQRLTETILKHNMQQCEFESNAGGDRIAFEVSTRVQDAGGRCNITTKPTETNKETRIIVNSDWVKKHCLFKMKEQYSAREDYGKMMSFLLSYSVAGKNLNDDVPDGFANFALFIQRKERIRPTYIINGGFWGNR